LGVVVFTKNKLDEDIVIGATTKEDNKVTTCVLLAAMDGREVHALDEVFELSSG